MTSKLLTCLLIILALSSGCSRDSSFDKDSEAIDSSMTPDSEVMVATIKLYDGSTVTASIDFDRLVRYESIDSVMAYTLDIHILDSAETSTTHIVGDSGIIRESSGTLNIYGNVVVLTADNIRLETESLWWNSKNNRIKTDAFVKITQEESIVTGWGLDADNKLQSIKILNKVSGDIKNTADVDL